MTVPAPGQDNPQERAKALLAVSRTVIDALSASLGDATRLAGEWQDQAAQFAARLEAATRERDALKAEVRGYASTAREQAFARAEAAERALEAARDALRAIADYYESEYREGEKAYQAAIVARFALDASASTQKDTKLCSRFEDGTEG